MCVWLVIELRITYFADHDHIRVPTLKSTATLVNTRRCCHDLVMTLILDVWSPQVMHVFQAFVKLNLC